LLPSAHEYYHRFGITEERLRHVHPNALIMHPGPINRGVEMSSAVADGLRSLILEQVANGIAVRMSAMALIAGNKSQVQREEPE
jgi:aspartate carbamoyltransferase catalytic subunit